MFDSIGVFDSGIGGLSILEELKKVLPNENFIYYGDSKNNPYGEKEEEELYGIVDNIVKYLINRKVKLIVIACNTATTRCMKKLQKDYPNIIFIGTVPAIKVACDNSYKNTLVMATPSTIKSKRTHELIADNKKIDQNITLLSCDGLAAAIETQNQQRIDSKLNEIVKNYKDKNIDSIVLGCTHYSLIKENISNYFPNADLLDGTVGVAKEVRRQLEVHNLLSPEGHQEIEIINSKIDDIIF